MTRQLYLEFPYSVKFTNKNAIPIKYVVNTLLAYDALLKRTKPFIYTACEEIEFAEIEVLIADMKAESIVEDFLVRLIFKDEDTYHKALEAVGKMGVPGIKQIYYFTIRKPLLLPLSHLCNYIFHPGTL